MRERVGFGEGEENAIKHKVFLEHDFGGLKSPRPALKDCPITDNKSCLNQAFLLVIICQASSSEFL